MSQPSQPGVLHHQLITAGESLPSGYILLLHGILGSGSNWATFARQVVERRPDWGCVLVDLREHGRSGPRPGPQTVTQCALDLLELESQIPGPVVGCSGHSFGSKVAILYAAARRERERPLERLWVVDGDPAVTSAESSGASVEWIIDNIESLPEVFERRADFVTQLQARGVAAGVAAWLGSNVRSEGGEYRFRLRLDAIRLLLADYRKTDAWPDLESESAIVRCVLGGTSEAVSASSRSRFIALGESKDHVNTVVVAGAGHWVHVDRPTELLEAFLA